MDTHPLVTTLQVAITKIFLSGFGWQLFALIPTSSTVESSLLTGVGDAVGTFLGNALYLIMVSSSRGKPSFDYVIRSGLVVSSGSLISGLVWQPLLNRCADNNYGFEVAMLVVGIGCGVSFFLGITMAAIISAKLQHDEERRPALDYVKDMTLSLSVVGATAAFVGTDNNFHGNWLQSIVGERNGEAIDCGKAGLSTVLGFVCAMFILLSVLPTRFMWTTPDSPEQCTIVGTNVDDSGASPLLLEGGGRPTLPSSNHGRPKVNLAARSLAPTFFGKRGEAYRDSCAMKEVRAGTI
jgi:hypothetical protein